MAATIFVRRARVVSSIDKACIFLSPLARWRSFGES
jgi:hypothetical protein